MEVPDVFRVSGIPLIDIFLINSYLNEVELFSSLFYTISQPRTRAFAASVWKQNAGLMITKKSQPRFKGR